jgi:hypothetical protein
LNFQKWECLRNDKCRRGTATPPYATSEVVAVLVGELYEWECLRKTTLCWKVKKEMARRYAANVRIGSRRWRRCREED